jgi:hypothetical protein
MHVVRSAIESLTNGFSWPPSLLVLEKLRFDRHVSNSSHRTMAGRLNNRTDMLQNAENT